MSNQTEEDYERQYQETLAAIQKAMWENDIDTLDRIARCECCCGDHTFESCYARLWGACRGQGSLTRADITKWEEHYAKTRGMTRDEFYGTFES